MGMPGTHTQGTCLLDMASSWPPRKPGAGLKDTNSTRASVLAS